MELVHFIGIGGIGMSGLAHIALRNNASVSGSDAVFSTRVENLQKQGAKIYIGHDAAHLSQDALVVVSTDIKPDNPELVEAKKRGQTILHRSEYLSHLMKGKKQLLVSGTHGKTTTSTLLAHTLIVAGLHPSFALGGISNNYGTNACLDVGDYFVAEADESDGSHLRYAPYASIVTNIDDDHLAHYGSIDAIEKALVSFARMPEKPSLRIFCKDDARLAKANIDGVCYGFASEADLQILNRVPCERGSRLVFLEKSTDIQYEVFLPLYGAHNAHNAAAVFLLTRKLGISADIIIHAFSTFNGVQRRLESIVSLPHFDLFDDYAHHPTEVAATLQAVREAYPDRRLIALFQPHRPSRLKTLFSSFSKAFASADEVYLTDLYASSESLDPEYSHEAFLSFIRSTHPTIPIDHLPRATLVEDLYRKIRPYDVVVFMGAGDSTKASRQLGDMLKQKGLPSLKVGLIYGGESSENKVSRVSAKSIAQALIQGNHTPIYFEVDAKGMWTLRQSVLPDEDGLVRTGPRLSPQIFEALTQCDMFFPILHGPMGEDGVMTAFFDLLDKPTVSVPFSGCCVSMDKAFSKHIVEAFGVKTAPYVVITEAGWQSDKKELLEQISTQLTLPYFVKPVHLGSSVGISKIQDLSKLEQAIENALLFDEKLVVESGIKGREIEFSVIGNDSIDVAGPGEILTDGQFYDFAAKYGASSFKALARAQELGEDEERGKALAKKVFHVLCGGQGLARIDFFYTPEGEYYFNEVNPMPGFTSISLFPSMWKQKGMTYEALVEKLLAQALKRHLLRKAKRGASIQEGLALAKVCAV